MSTLQPASNQTPDAVLGGIAVTGISNTGHTSTVTSASAVGQGGEVENFEETKSARWFAIPAGPASPISLKLKANWSVVGSVSVVQHLSGTGSASIVFEIDYTVDGGSNWINTVSKSKTVGINQSDSINESGSVDVTLNLSQNTTLVQLRTRAFAVASAFAPDVPGASVDSNASITTSINTIQVEAEEATTPPSSTGISPIVMM